MTTIAKVLSLPKCNFNCPEDALYDFKTIDGPWAYGCQRHYDGNKFFDDLGTGKGQKLEVAE